MIKINKKSNFKERIMKKLEYNDVFNLSFYKRLYPDTLEEARGYFQIKVSYWIDRQYEICDCEFDIIPKEDSYSEPNSLEFYKHFATEQELFEYIAKFLDQFRTVRELYNHVYAKFKFIKPSTMFANDSLLDLYYEIKDDLEDGTTLLDFVDRIRL